MIFINDEVLTCEFWSIDCEGIQGLMLIFSEMSDMVFCSKKDIPYGTQLNITI